MFKPWSVIFLVLAVAACSQGTPVTGSAWQLAASDSDITFLSVKNGDVAEISRFETVSGTLSADGRARLFVDAASVESYVDIRNERLRDIFFEVTQFPQIELSADLDPAQFETLETGDSLTTELRLTVRLHDVAREAYADVRVLRLTGDRVVVTSIEPVLIDVRDYGLGEAVEALRELAGLNSISPVIPVSAYLVFDRA